MRALSRLLFARMIVLDITAGLLIFPVLVGMAAHALRTAGTTHLGFDASTGTAAHLVAKAIGDSMTAFRTVMAMTTGLVISRGLIDHLVAEERVPICLVPGITNSSPRRGTDSPASCK